jgi:hypothetical protein
MGIIFNEKIVSVFIHSLAELGNETLTAAKKLFLVAIAEDMET